MASSVLPEETPLTTLYLQVDRSESPAAILGVGTEATEAEVRDAYRSLVVRLHPDKVVDNLRELHTSLFQKLHAAYETLLEDNFGLSCHHDQGRAASKRLPETAESLHARIFDFKDALRRERERALDAKRAAAALKALKESRLQAKNERLAEKRALRAEKLEHQRVKKGAEVKKRRAQVAKRIGLTERRNKEYVTERSAEERQVEIGSDNEDAEDPLPPVQDKPTSLTARPMWDTAVDERLVCDAEIKNRWDKNLLSGGRSGSVSLSQKKQKQHSGAARIHKRTFALSEEADHMLKPALTGNRTFSALKEDDLHQMAFLRAEASGEARTDWVLAVMDKDVIERHFIEYGMQNLSLTWSWDEREGEA